jgi:SulP family sulfate permease
MTGAAYAFFGSSGQLCVGPVALVSLLTGELINSYGIDYVNNPQEAVDFAGEVALAVGLVLVVMSLLNLGNLIRFISHPVMSGFTTAAACLIGMNQIKSAFGFTVKVPQQGQTDFDYNYQVMHWLISHWNGVYHFTTAQITKKKSLAMQDNMLYRNPTAAKICFGLYIPLLLIVIFKNNLKATPERKKSLWYNAFTIGSALMPFVAIIIGAHVAWQIKHDDGYNNPKITHDWYSYKLSIVGKVQPGLDFLRAPSFKWPFLQLIGDIIPIALVAYMESYGVAQRIAHQHQEFHLLSASQELWAIGVANMLSACSSAYPVAGSFSRSSLNSVSGAKTAFSKVVNMIVVVLALQFLTTTFQYIPNAALAAIIWVAVYNLICVTDFWNAWKHSKKDFFVMLSSFIFVFVFNTEVGLAVGIGLSVFIYLFDTTFNPENAPILLKDNNEETKNGMIRHVYLRGDFNFLTSGRILDLLTSLTLVEQRKPDVFDSTWGDRMFFKVSSFFDSWLKPHLIESVGNKMPKAIILDLTNVRVMDITALHDIEEQSKNARHKKVSFLVINASPIITKSLMKFGIKNDDLTGMFDEKLVDYYHKLSGDEIPRNLPKAIKEEGESSSEAREEESVNEVSLVPHSLAPVHDSSPPTRRHHSHVAIPSEDKTV